MNFFFSKPVPSHVAKKLLTPTRGEITHAHRLLRRKFDRNEASDQLQIGRDKMRGLRLSLNLGRDIQPSLKEICSGSNVKKNEDKKKLAQRIRGIEEHSIAVGNPKKGVRPEGLVTFAANYEGWEGIQEYYNDLKIYNPLQVNRRMAIGSHIWTINSMSRDIMVRQHIPRFIIAPGVFSFLEYNVHLMLGIDGLPPLLAPLLFLVLKGQGGRYFPAAMKSYLSTFVTMPRLLDHRAFHQASHDAFWGPTANTVLEAREAGEDDHVELGDWFFESYNYLVPSALIEKPEFTRHMFNHEIQSPPVRKKGPQNKMVYIDRLMDFRGDEPELTVVVRIADSAFKFAKQDEKKQSTAFMGALTFGAN